jgi:ComF family protein
MKTAPLFPRIKKAIMDLFFPYECLSCAKEGYFLCDNCKNTISISGHQFPLPFVSWAYTFGKYDHPLFSKCIKAFKYRYSKEFLEDFRSIFERSFPIEKLQQKTIFVPIPLFHIREKQRGFNQSMLLAELFSDIAKNLYQKKIPILSILKRTRNTPPQATLSVCQRKTNLQGAFEITNLQNAEPTDFLVLIDDVATTGSTLIECAKILKKNGYHNIGAIVIAHG